MVWTGADVNVLPFMDQTVFCPDEVLRHRTSALRSPSKSPKPTGLHCTGIAPNTTIVLVVPFISQRPGWPVLTLYQKRSALPSPLKSPAPKMRQFRSDTVSSGAEGNVLPFMNQTVSWP